MALAVACDWRVAASDASLYVPELKLGMNMSWQSVPRFVNLIGPAKTKRLLLLAERPPVPLRMINRAVNTCANALNDATSFMDADQFLLTMDMQDAREGAEAFFEKCSPEFKGN